MKLFNVKFDAKKAAALAILAGMLTGCGLQRQGQYEGTEFATANGVVSQNQLVMTIQEQDNQRVTGTWSSGRGSAPTSTGTFRGVMNGNEIQKIYLTKTNSSSTNPIMTGGMSPVGVSNVSYMNFDGSVVCLGDYQGTLRFDGNSISGALQPINTYQGLQGNICTQLEVDVIRVN